MKNKMTKIADCIAPMKSMKFKQNEQFPLTIFIVFSVNETSYTLHKKIRLTIIKK